LEHVPPFRLQQDPEPSSVIHHDFTLCQNITVVV